VWFPVNEHPRDKATYDVTITVPRGKTAISNGLPVGDPVTSASGTTWHWRSERPMASYLVLLAVGDYVVTKSTSASGIPIIDAVDPAAVQASASALARQSDVLDFLADRFGPYPFEAAGAVVAEGLPEVALETQTRSLYSASTITTDGSGVSVLVHETAHQWFGDSVSLARWQDVWLNEGFATYAEVLWAEKNGGFSPSRMIPDALESNPADAPLWATDVSDPGNGSLFGPAVYQRGALVLEALREVVGDEAFFTTLRTWAAEHRDGNATTADFVALAQRVSRRDLTEVFGTWLFGAGRPDSWDPAAVAQRHPVGSAPAG
jgi:aminopeptidase N